VADLQVKLKYLFHTSYVVLGEIVFNPNMKVALNCPEPQTANETPENRMFPLSVLRCSVRSLQQTCVTSRHNTNFSVQWT